MTPAMSFQTPLLLIGAAAAAIPFVLHLLASVRARDIYFPTLRFLRISMEKTARRRHVQHWLLLLLRAALLALLAVAVAEPFTRPEAGAAAPAGRRPYAAVLLIDNSLSMHARNPGRDGREGDSRFAKALADAEALLTGEHAPALAAVRFTNEPTALEPLPSDPATQPAEELSEDLDALKRRMTAQAQLTTTEAGLPAQVAAAVELLKRRSRYEDKAVFVFSDMQRATFDALSAAIRETPAARRVRLVFVRSATADVRNVSVADVKVAGRPVAGEELQIEAELANSSPDVVDVGAALVVGGEQVAKQDKVLILQPAGAEGATATAVFRYTPRTAGPISGEVVIAVEGDAFPQDDQRQFTLTVGSGAKVVLVAGPVSRTDPPAYSPAGVVRQMLASLGEARGSISLDPPTALAPEAFSPAALVGKDALVLCDVPALTDPQARAVGRFVRRGGSLVLLLGGNADVDACNRLLAEQGLLPGRLAPATGLFDPRAGAARPAKLDIGHPLLANLDPYVEEADYPAVQVWRHYPLELPAGTDVRVAARQGRSDADHGDPLIVTRTLGAGRVTLCTTIPSPTWSNLSSRAAPVLMAMMYRGVLSPAQADLARANAYLPDQPVTLSLGGEDPATIELRPPRGNPVRRTGARDGLMLLRRAPQLGLYHWTVSDVPDGAGGAFVVNPQRAECDLRPVADAELREGLAEARIENVYVGAALPRPEEATAPPPPETRDWWDVVLVAVILLLIVEAVVANRFRRRDAEAIPVHLNPRISR